MSKILLVAVNASYSHTNLAVRYLKYYAQNKIPSASFNCSASIEFAEFTINQNEGEILRGISDFSPEIVIFSTYIWNATIVSKLIPEIAKIIPDCAVGAGGPEFGYWAEGYLKKLPELDFVMSGEGEETFSQLASAFADGKYSKEKLKEIPGLYISEKNGKPLFTGPREPLCDLSALPFPYPEITEPDTKIHYYESNRGCPFSCSYCLSSVEKKVRFMPLERVYKDLQRFLNAKVRLVKFVDRTFNLNSERYINIWKYILSHHNGKTMFHFEIEAEYLSEEALEFLKQVPSGVMQFEIGVQSANPETLKAISRSSELKKLAENIRRIPKTIHSHLDLIAGLPYEDLKSFGKSFDFVMNLRPDALQLGFLKILHGTSMERYATENGWKWMQTPNYETFSTPYLSYQDMMFLKDVETLLDVFYNSGTFATTTEYIFRHISPWNFFCPVTEIARKNNALQSARKESYWFDFLAHLELKNGKICELNAKPSERTDCLYDLLRYDFVRQGKKGNFPEWYCHHYDKDKHRKLLEQNGGIHNSRLDFGYSEYEVFNFNPESESPENTCGHHEILIKYIRKQNL